jgi:SulP family sulfate permease
MNSSKFSFILDPIRKYSWLTLRKDFVAGMVVGIVLIPQGMAYATIADLPPILGLYAGLLPLLLYALLGRSRNLAIGPVALDMLILSAGLGALAGDDPAQRVQYALFIASITGLLQILMGSFRLGQAFNLIARSVISGFTIAAPFIIIASQLDTLLGLEIPSSQYVHRILVSLYHHIENYHLETLLSSLLFILLLLVLKKWVKGIPGSVLVMGATLLALLFIDPADYDIDQVGAIPQGLPSFEWKHLAFGELKRIFPTALTLSLIQFMSIASLAKTYARKDGNNVDPNRELVAVGTANLLGGFFQSPPVSASFSRSAIAREEGSQTTFFNVFTAVLMLLTLLFLTPVFEQLPRNLLSSIIVLSVVGLIDIKEIRYLLHAKRRDAMIAGITFLGVLFIGIQEGVILGISSSALAILIKLAKPTVAELGSLPGTREFRNVERFEEAQSIPGVLILRIDASFSFVNASFFKKYILKKSRQNQQISYLIIDGTTISDMDITAMESLSDLIDDLDQKGIELFIAGLIGPVRDILSKSESESLKDPSRYYSTLHDAVKHTLHLQDEGDAGDRLSQYLRDCD